MAHTPEPEKKFPNVITDENGSVMVEFTIVAPLLLTLMLMEFFFIDFNRFHINAQQLANTMGWKRVGENFNTGFSDADMSFSAPPSLPGAGSFGTALGAASNYTVVSGVGPPAVALATAPGIGAGRASAMHASNMLDGHILGTLGVNGKSRAIVDMGPGAQELGAPVNDITYRNSTFIQPLVNLIHSGTWIGKDGAETSANVALQDYFLKVPAAGISMSDPGSVFWGNKEKRARYVDRYTILRDPGYFAGAVVQTLVSGGIFAMAEIPTFMDDAYGTNALIPGLESYTDFTDGISGLFSVMASLTEQAQPMRKVDKIVNTEDHDEGLEFPFHTYEIPEKYKLEQDDSSKWEQFQ